MKSNRIFVVIKIGSLHDNGTRSAWDPPLHPSKDIIMTKYKGEKKKDPDAGKDWRQKEKGMTEDEMVGWQYQLNGHEFEQTPGDSGGQPGVLQSMGSQSGTRLSNWTTATGRIIIKDTGTQETRATPPRAQGAGRQVMKCTQAANASAGRAAAAGGHC